MGLLPSLRILTMSQLVLLCLTAASAQQFRTFEAANPFPIGSFHNLLHPSPTIQWPNFFPVREATRSSRQNQPANSAIADASFIPLGSGVPLEPEHRAYAPHYDPAQNDISQQLPPVPSTVPLPPPAPAPIQQSPQPQPQQFQPQVQQFQPSPQPFQPQPFQPPQPIQQPQPPFQPQVQQQQPQPFQPQVQQQQPQPFQPQQQPPQPPPLESPRPPYGAAPTAPLIAQPQPNRNPESPLQNLLVWPSQQQQQKPAPVAPAPPQAQERAGGRYGSSRPSVFGNSPTSQFAHRSFEMPPSPAELGFPSVSNTQENWNYDINWAEFAGRRRRRSAQRPIQRQSRPPPVAARRRDIYEGDNLALEDRRAIETRVAPPSRPRPSERERHEREGNAHKQEKQEYDGPYVYTQLFGPPYEVGYIRSPIPSKHVYEDYLQFVRSWSSASREAVDEQLRTNPSAVKNFASSKYTETSSAYKEPAVPAYKEPSAPEYREPAFKGPSPSYKEPAYKDPVYREPEYKEPAFSKEPEYKEPAYKDPEPAYKEPAPAYKEPEYKNPAPAYKEPAYSKEPEYKEPAYKEEEAYRGQTSTEPVFRGETYRESYKETAHKSPAYQEETYQAPNINYHSPNSDYAAPDTEFRPTNRPFHATGPKSPVVMERDFVPIKSQNGPALYDAPNPTTYRTPTSASGYDAPATYDILKPFEKARPSGAYSSGSSYDSPPTAVYEPVTAKYKPTAETYDAPSKAYEAPSKGYDAPTKGYDAPTKGYEAPKTYDAPISYEVPKRYETPPEAGKKYEAPAPPQRKPSPSVAYYQPPTRYVEPPQYNTKGQGSYESPAAQSYDTPSKYSEPSAAYETPKKFYESSTKYAEAALYISTTSRPDSGYRIEPLTTPSYKDPADDYAPNSYKDDVELSSTSYQAVAQNYDNQQPPTAYDQIRKPEESGYLPAKESYGDEPKKTDDGYADSAGEYETSTTKKKHYPVIIGRYQVTDSSAFLPKKVEGNGGKSVGSHVHGSNGDEYVVYYLPYGQPLPIPVRRRRSAIEAPEEPVYTVRRYRNLAEGQPQRRRLRGQKRQQLEEQVLSPEEAHKLLKFPVPNEYRESSKEAAAPVTDATPVVESQDVEQQLSPADGSAPADEVKEEIVQQEEGVSVSDAVPEVPAQEETEVEQIQQQENEPVVLPPIDDAQEETTPEPQPLVGEEEAERVHDIVAEEEEAAAPVQDDFMAQIQQDVAKGDLIPVDEEMPSIAPVDEPAEDEKSVVGEIIIVKEVAEEIVEDAPVVDEGGIANVNLITDEQEEPEVVEPPAIAEEAFITHENDQHANPPVHYKKKNPGVIDTIPVLPGLTQRPVKYLRPPGIASDPQEQWNGYSTWWTKLGNRVAKIYNYE